MTAIAIPDPMLAAAREVRDAQAVTRLAVADASRFTVDTRRSSVGEAVRRWAAGRFVRSVDKRLVHPVLRASSPTAMHAELDRRIPVVLGTLRAASLTALAVGLVRLDSVASAAGWEHLLESLSTRDLDHLDGAAVARLRVALASHALASHDLQRAAADPSCILDQGALRRGLAVMSTAFVPMFVLLAWTHDRGPVRGDVLDALGERVERESDELSTAFAHAVRGGEG